MLHVINGDMAAQRVKECAIEGDILPWRDSLHLGPVPAKLTLPALSQIRADYLESSYPNSGMDIHQAMQQRDARLLDACRHNEPITLWFEHDLYDQLQLLQVLDTLADFPSSAHRQLICINHHPGIDPFYGLGQLSATQMAQLSTQAQAITPQQLKLGQQGWQAVRSSDPTVLTTLLDQPLLALPFLHNALLRLVEEYPSRHNGLNRTELQCLQNITQQGIDPIELFGQCQQMEEARFMGDWGFWQIIKTLCSGENPLIETATKAPFIHPPHSSDTDRFRQQRLHLTKTGEAVLCGNKDRVDEIGMDYWVGGVHLTPDNDWRWDADNQQLVRRR